MVVKIRFPNRNRGDQCLELELEDAKNEIEIGIKNGYIPVYKGKSVKAEQVQDGQTVTMVPPVQGG